MENIDGKETEVPPTIIINEKSSKPFRCTSPGCNASFPKLFRLKIHIRQHTGKRPFLCNIPGCNKSYTNAMHLKRHKNVVHEALEEVMCDVSGCGMVLCGKQNLKKHHLRAHDPNYMPYKCYVCNDTFKKKNLLRKHLETHFPEKDLKCETCNINFTCTQDYLKHKRSHKTYDCDCGVSFDRWSKFCKHRKICNVKRIDHRCTICNKVFTTKSNLKAHSLVHVEESNSEVYRCVYLNCNRSYKYKKNLTFHVKCFHEEKNITEAKVDCTYPGCGVILKSKKNLKQHIANMHSDKPKAVKPRKTRKDKGVPKKNMINYLSVVNIEPVMSIMGTNEHKNNSTNNNESGYRKDYTEDGTPKEHIPSNDIEIVDPIYNIIK